MMKCWRTSGLPRKDCWICKDKSSKRRWRKRIRKASSGNSRLNLAVALLDGVACRIGLSILLGVTFAWGITGFWYGNAISGCVPFVIGFAFLLSGRWKIEKKATKAKAAVD